MFSKVWSIKIKKLGLESSKAPPEKIILNNEYKNQYYLMQKLVFSSCPFLH